MCRGAAGLVGAGQARLDNLPKLLDGVVQAPPWCSSWQHAGWFLCPPAFHLPQATQLTRTAGSSLTTRSSMRRLYERMSTILSCHDTSAEFLTPVLSCHSFGAAHAVPLLPIGSYLQQTCMRLRHMCPQRACARARVRGLGERRCTQAEAATRATPPAELSIRQERVLHSHARGLAMCHDFFLWKGLQGDGKGQASGSPKPNQHRQAPAPPKAQTQ